MMSSCHDLLQCQCHQIWASHLIYWSIHPLSSTRYMQKLFCKHTYLCPPTMGGGGGGGEHIVFSADPVGVGGGVASCPHSISLLNGQILAKLTQIYHWEGEKCWLDFDDLDPIFKVTGGLRLLENGLSTPCLLNEWIDFNQTCTSILLGHVKELIRFWWPWSHFQGHRRA